MNTLYIRTEANVTTAMGHMARCLTIADAVKALGGQAVFIVAEEGSAKFPKERGHEVICLDRKWDDFDGEIEVMTSLIKEKNIKSLLVDSYYVNEAYMAALNKLTYLSYIDDLYEKIWPVSCIINYSIYAEGLPEKAAQSSEDSKDKFCYKMDYPETDLILGTGYFPLRKEFLPIVKRQIHEKIKNVLVVTGGSDIYHFMLNILVHIMNDSELKDVNFNFICGSFHEDREKLLEMAKDADNIKILNTQPSLKEVMDQSDIMISAGGTTLYEAASCGLPAICFSFADNQHYNVWSFDSEGYALYAGDVRNNFSYPGIIDMLKSFDKNKRQLMSDKLQSLVDGKGAERIAKHLLNKAK